MSHSVHHTLGSEKIITAVPRILKTTDLAAHSTQPDNGWQTYAKHVNGSTWIYV